MVLKGINDANDAIVHEYQIPLSTFFQSAPSIWVMLKNTKYLALVTCFAWGGGGLQQRAGTAGMAWYSFSFWQLGI